ncbi:MAG TPA: futalosine hydrolase [Pyrinomonadaceae bacterium]|nr:futalosine hydrolase [Pyrinomonadaceae bacterium]
MRILIVAATHSEITPFAAHLHERSRTGPNVKQYEHAQHQIAILTTGIGMVATAAWCSQFLTQDAYDIALNFGVCGSFDRDIEPARVIHVTSDLIAELGAEEDEDFLTAQEMKLLEVDESPLTNGRLVNASPPKSATLAALATVDGITVNTAHGNERSIAAVVSRFHPQVESMEGAAFMYACIIHRVPFAQIRAVSNFVEKRNREAWKFIDAIRNLTEAGLRILEEL